MQVIYCTEYNFKKPEDKFKQKIIIFENKLGTVHPKRFFTERGGKVDCCCGLDSTVN